MPETTCLQTSLKRKRDSDRKEKKLKKQKKIFTFDPITNEFNNNFLIDKFKLLLSTEKCIYKRPVWENFISVLREIKFVVTSGEQLLSLKMKGIGKGTARRVDDFLKNNYTFNETVEIKDTISCLVVGIICGIGQCTEKQHISGKELIKSHYQKQFLPKTNFDSQRKQEYLQSSTKDFKNVDKDIGKNEVFQIQLNDKITLISNIFQITKDGETIILLNRYDEKGKLSWGEWKKEELECQMICNMAVCRAKKAIMKFEKCDVELKLEFCDEKWKKFLKILQEWSNCEICTSSMTSINCNYKRVFTEHGKWCHLCEKTNMCIDTSCKTCYQKSFQSSEMFTFRGNKVVDYWSTAKNFGKTPRMIQSISNQEFYFDCDDCHKSFKRTIKDINKWCPYCSNHKRYSKEQIQWLDKIAFCENIYIQHAENEGEFEIPNTNYKAAGTCKEKL